MPKECYNESASLHVITAYPHRSLEQYSTIKGIWSAGSYFFKKIVVFDISCKLSPQEEIKKNIFNCHQFFTHHAMQLIARLYHMSPLFSLQLKDQLTNNKMYCLELPGTPKSLESHTPTSEDLPPYDTPPLSASHSSKEDCFNGILFFCWLAQYLVYNILF